MIENEKLIGRCGIYCGECIIYLASHGHEILKDKAAQKHGCHPEDISCDGCQGDRDKCWCRDKNWGKNCAIIECQDKNNLNYCNECSEFQKCDKFNNLADHYIKKGDDLRKNLNEIKKDKQTWLNYQKNKYEIHNHIHNIPRYKNG